MAKPSSKPRYNPSQYFKKTPSNPRKPQQPRRHHRTEKRSPPSPPTASSMEENPDISQVLQAFQEEQMGRHVFLLAVPISAGFLAYANPMSAPRHVRLAIVAVSVGATAIWIGILLRRVLPRAAAAALELIGATFMLLAFFSFLGSRLPGSLQWIPLLCFGIITLIPIAAAVLCRRKNGPENGDDPAPAGGFDMV